MPDSVDKMSEDADDGVSSTGLSDDGSASLVGFGEAASSNFSGPTPAVGRVPGVIGSTASKQQRQRHESSGSPMEGVEEHSIKAETVNARTVGTDTSLQRKEDGVAYASVGAQEAEKIIGDTMRDVEGKMMGSSVHGRELGKFSFEES